MNYLISAAVLTACLRIKGYQQKLGTFGPFPEGLGCNYHYEPKQLNSSHTGSCEPLVLPHFTISIEVYTSLYYMMTYFAGSFWRYNLHAKVFWWLITIYPTITALTGFQFYTLQPYLLQLVPVITGLPVRIDNYSSLETRAQELESNPKPRFLWAAKPGDCGTAHLHFPGVEPPQAETKHIDPQGRKSQTKGIITLNGGLITAPNGGTELATNSLVNLKSMPTTNQEQTQEGGMGLQPGPMTLAPEQDNQAANSRFWTNERTPGPSAILPPFDPSTQFPRPWHSQCLDQPPMKNVRFGGGTI
ncbi:hypothetical protein DSO57_1039142 [Entomophthora muscae]|uniref:Uncharacterized protein n=1 Tax=Entomophthora muscae TaxID=34485 RepID=A0ACC2RPG2_9FUNG|nr:hypothetical protein DSO57_1039142 [Entomophthora muscae]